MGTSFGSVQGSGNTGGSGSSSSLKEKLSNSEAYNIAVKTIGGVAGQFPTPNENLNKNTQQMASIRNSASDALLSSGNPYAMAGGAALKVMGATGGFTDASEGLGTGTDNLNKFASLALPGAGWFTKPVEKYSVGTDTQVMQSGYASTIKNNEKAAKNAGAKLLFGRSKARSMIHEAKAKDMLISNIKEEADDNYASMASLTQAKSMSDQYAYEGGYQQALARAGKLGMKLTKARQIANRLTPLLPEFQEGGIIETDNLINEPEEIEKFIPKDPAEFFNNITFDDVPEFKDGGKVIEESNIEKFVPTTPEQDAQFFKSLVFDDVQEFKEGGQMNVIPEGNLHARLHHMNGADELTKKGIPVVDNDGNQQAEIELNEIIFNLDVSTKLEELHKKYKEEGSDKDKIAIEAGKLLAEQIMENTDDRTGLIAQVQ